MLELEPRKLKSVHARMTPLVDVALSHVVADHYSDDYVNFAVNDDPREVSAMGALVYGMITSVDGFVADHDGGFDWGEPDDEVHAFLNEREREVGISLLGRRMYELMSYWETSNDVPGLSLVAYEFGSIWRSHDKVVFSTTLDNVTTERTRLMRSFDAAEIAALKASTPLQLAINGPTLAAHAIAAGLVDEFHIYRHPLSIGGGLPFLPLGARLDLSLIDAQRFTSGVIFEKYAPRRR